MLTALAKPGDRQSGTDAAFALRKNPKTATADKNLFTFTGVKQRAQILVNVSTPELRQGIP